MKKIAIMGDSITKNMPYYIDKTIKRGFNEPMISDKLPNSDFLFYICGIENIGIGTFHENCWPKVNKDEMDGFILLIGVNNILRPDCDYDNKETLDDIFEKLKNFIEDILNYGKPLIVETLYPTNLININKKIITLNEKLIKYCEEKSIDYLDLYSTLADNNGFINSHFSDDGLHPNEKGYEIIINELTEKLKTKSPKSLCK